MNQKPKPRRKRKEPLLLAWCMILIAPALFLAALAAPVPAGKPASYPAWWFEREVIKRTDTNVTSPLWPTNYLVADDFGALNAGQLKTLASRAFDELQEKLPASVWQGDTNAPGVQLSSLVNAWHTNTASGDPFAAVNQGQLKTLAKHFYDVLGQAGYVAGQGLPPAGWTNGAYPWSVSTNAPDAYAAANIGQAKYLFSFDLTVFSADGDSLPDFWENEHFGNLDSDGDGDFDEDGLSNLEEFQQGTDPQDFYNGQHAVLEIVGGNNQGDLPGATLANPYEVRVSNQLGTLKAGANVTFTIQSGGGQLTVVNGGMTDDYGIARVSLQLPTTIGATILTQAAFGTLNVTFTVTVGDPNAPTSAAPSKPVVTLQNGGTEALIKWKDRCNNETAYYVERTDDGVNWERRPNATFTLPANTTSFTDTGLTPGHGYYYRIVVYNETP